MQGFAKLIPAFIAHANTAKIAIDTPFSVGSVSPSGPLTVVPLTVPSATNNNSISYLKSLDTYPIKVNAIFQHGSDYIRADADGKHVRLDVKSVLKDQKTSALLVFKYSGIIEMTEGPAAVLGGKPNAKTTEFGDVFTHALFETGAPELKKLETKIYVGSGRFILETGKPVIVEYKISEVDL